MEQANCNKLNMWLEQGGGIKPVGRFGKSQRRRLNKWNYLVQFEKLFIRNIN